MVLFCGFRRVPSLSVSGSELTDGKTGHLKYGPLRWRKCDLELPLKLLSLPSDQREDHRVRKVALQFRRHGKCFHCFNATIYNPTLDCFEGIAVGERGLVLMGSDHPLNVCDVSADQLSALEHINIAGVW